MDSIKTDIDELFQTLSESKLYKDYISIKEKIRKDKDITNIINQIKRYQKIGTNNKDNSVEEKINELNKKLESYPIYQSYLITKEELENELFQIKEIFEKYFHDILKLEE